MGRNRITPFFLLFCILIAIGLAGCREQVEEPVVVVPTRPSGETTRESSPVPEEDSTEEDLPDSADSSTLTTKEAGSTDQTTPETEETELDDPASLENAEQLLYRVNFVADDDHLNVRRNPGVDSRIVTKLSPRADGINVTGKGRWLGNSFWVPVEAGDESGWVNSRFITEQMDSQLFCSDGDVEALLERLAQAVSSRDDADFAALVEPGRGLRIRRHWWNPEILLEDDTIANIFKNDEIYHWGTADGSGDDIDGSFNDIILPLLEENLLAASEVSCGEILHGGTAGIVQIPAAYEGIQFYSFYRPPGPDQVEFDWGAWVVGIESWQGEYRLSFLIHYEWEI